MTTAQHEPRRPSREQLGDPLSERQLEVLTLVATGASNREIARELAITVPTVAGIMNRVYRKTGTRNRVQATRYYLDHFELPDPPL